ncbi:MAG: AIM24 family protein, partial [Ktedonobacteraceae bacterium]
MICPRCQSQVAEGVKFCGVCGSPMQVSQTPPPASQTPPPQAQPQSQYGAPAQGSAYVPPNQYEEYSSNQALGGQVPRAELHNPKGPLHVADMTITVDGQLVPVADVMLGGQLPIYFEHHILLWKHPGVQIGFKSMRGVAKRFFAGIQIFLTEAQGPGNISFSRDAPGQIVALRLQP